MANLATSSHKLIEMIRNSNMSSADQPYPYVLGVCWAIMNEEQREYAFNFVEKKTKETQE